MDSLTIKNITVFTRIGIHAWEQQIKQRLLIDLVIQTDFRDCRDQIEDTIDYDNLCQSVRGFIENQSFNLIETVADSLAAHIKKTFPVDALSVSVSKPQALAQVQNVMVTVNR